MPDPKPSRPRLVNLNQDANEGAPPAQKPARVSRGPVFWLLVALTVVAAIGFAMQTERVRVLQSSNAALEGELFSVRTALTAYTDRFAVVRDTVAGLRSQIDALNALVSEDPVPSETGPADPATPPGAPTPLD